MGVVIECHEVQSSLADDVREGGAAVADGMAAALGVERHADGALRYQALASCTSRASRHIRTRRHTAPARRSV